MRDFETLLRDSAARHGDRLCPRQVLGVRMGLYAAELSNLNLPQADKRLFCFVETDGCLMDGVGVATGCSCGRRTMHLMDYGKTAATFVDTHTQRAWRIRPTKTSRTCAARYAPDAVDRWHAQLAAYQIMPTDELLQAHPVKLTVSLARLISRHGGRVACENCGEDIINERERIQGGRVLCRACAEGAYYTVAERPTQAVTISAIAEMPGILERV